MIDLETKRFCKHSRQRGINVLHGLYDLIKENITNNYVICEIGSYRGVSSSLLAEFCHKLYCIDPWIPYSNDIDGVSHSMIADAEKEFDERSANFTNIIKIKKSSLDACATFENHYFDMIYIDGSHSYQDVKNDITHWKEKIKPGGLISGHDYSIISVNKAISDTIGLHDIKTYSDSSWIKRINL